MIHFRALGTLDLRNTQGELRSVLAQPRRLALLAWLLLERPPGYQSRDQARALFWPEHDDAHARKALNRAVYWLRKSLGDGVLLSRGGQELGIAAAECWTDVAAFEAAVADARLADAAALYRGDLLRGFHVSDASGFERWLEAERQRLRILANQVGRSLSETAVQCEEPSQAVHWARWTLERFPADEGSLCHLMRALTATGDRTGALQEYEEFAHRLEAEFELQPSEETMALAVAIRASNRPLAGDITVDDRLQDAEVQASPFTAAPDTGGASDEPGEEVMPELRHVPSRLQSQRSRVALAAVLVVLGLGGATLVVNRRANDTNGDSQRVVILPLENRTADPAFDNLTELASEWIVQGLTRIDGEEAYAPSPVTGGALTGQPAGVIERGFAPKQSRWVIGGAIYRAGAFLRFEGNVSTAEGAILWTLRSGTVPADSMEPAIREIRDRVTGAIAILANPRFASWLPRATATPPTFDAFAAFEQGDELLLNGRMREAIAQFTSAAAIDSMFTMARLQIAETRVNLLDYATAESMAVSLDGVRHRLTTLELAWLDYVHAVVREDRDQAQRAVTIAANIAPDRFLGLRAEVLTWFNRPREIVRLLESAGPGSPYNARGAPYWARLADAYHQVGQHRRELATARRMRRVRPASWASVWAEIRALAALGRTEDVTERIEFTESLPRHARVSTGTLMLRAAEELNAHGQHLAAARLLDRSIDWFHGLPAEEAGLLENRAELARILYLAGRLDEAEPVYRRLAAEDPINAPEYYASLGTIAARRGDRKSAEDFLSLLEHQRLAMNPPPKWALYAQARIYASLGDAGRAVRMLREALGGQGVDLHLEPDFASLAGDAGFRNVIRPKG